MLWQVTNLWQREIRKALEKYDLTHSQFVLLASISWLTSQNQDITQTLLSAHTKIDPMTTSMVLRTLQKKGLISRHEHITDTRAKTVGLTASGEKMAMLAVKSVESFDDLFFHSLGDNLPAFNGMLEVLLKQ
ncbi:MAG: MarR family winged helix-turn-helix transcriptional regulator [Bacteroidota bacterium]